MHAAVGRQLGLCQSSYRLVFVDGDISNRERTIRECGIVDGDVLYGLVQQVGSIGIWRAPDNVHPFLLDPPMTPSTSSPPKDLSPKDADLALLVAKLTKGQREDLTGTTVLDERLERALDPALCEKLRRLLDQRQLAETHKNNNNNNNSKSTTIADTTADYKLYLTYSELSQHIGDVAAAALSRRIQGDYTFIVLRRCEPQGDIEPNQHWHGMALQIRCHNLHFLSIH